MSNEPVVNNTAIAGGALIVGPLLARYGIDQGGTQAIVGGLLGIGACVGAIWRVFVARKKVTPLANPTNAAGQALTPDQ